MTVRAILGALEGHPFLDALSEKQRMILASGMEPFSVEQGERFIREGEPAKGFYLIRAGEVQIEADQSEDEEPLAVEALGPGEVVGWSWLLPPHRWQFSARALGRAQGCYLDGAWLRDLCEKDSYLGARLYRQLVVVLTQRLTALRQRQWDPEVSLLEVV
jgi:CRP-like cAMP-binding protein